MFFGKRTRRDPLARLKSSIERSPISISGSGVDGIPERALVDVLYVLLQAPEGRELVRITGGIYQAVVDLRCSVVTNAGGIVQIAVGPRTDEADPILLRRKLAALIAAIAKDHAAVAHGQIWCDVGVLGVDQRKMWGVFPLESRKILKMLAEVPLGNIIELSEQDAA